MSTLTLSNNAIWRIQAICIIFSVQLCSVLEMTQFGRTFFISFQIFFPHAIIYNIAIIFAGTLIACPIERITSKMQYNIHHESFVLYICSGDDTLIFIGRTNQPCTNMGVNNQFLLVFVQINFIMIIRRTTMELVLQINLQTSFNLLLR